MVNALLKTKSLSSKLITFLRFLIALCLLYIIFSSYKNLVVYKRTLSKKHSDIIIDNIFISRHSLLINETNKTIMRLYYRHATSERNSSYPFISGDTFRAFADFVFDETRQDNLTSVKYGDIVFVKADMFHQFFGKPYESITNFFVLVTHNSDFYAPNSFRSRLEDKKIIAWYGSNPDVRNHAKFFPIPIGLANRRWPGGNLNKLTYAFEKHRKPWLNRTTLLYVNFNLGTNKAQRQAALSQAKLIKDVQIITKSVSFETYLEQVGNAKFVLSPPGNGIDCHRTWEALMLGAAPVVLSSGLDPLFNKIPSVIIDNWAKLTENFLLSYNFSSYDNTVPSVLYARYWRETLLKYRDKSPK
jgi:hypothetical protein